MPDAHSAAADQMAAARDLIADGYSRGDAAAALQAQFGISQATAYRRIAAAVDAEASGDAEAPGGDGWVEVAYDALRTLHRIMCDSAAAGDVEAATKAAQALTGACARLRVARVPVAR